MNLTNAYTTFRSWTSWWKHKVFSVRYDIKIIYRALSLFRVFTAKTCVRSRVSPCCICGCRCATEKGFSPSTSGFLLPLSFHHHSILIFFVVKLLSQWRTVETWKSSNKEILCTCRKAFGRKVFPSLTFKGSSCNCCIIVTSVTATVCIFC
jgi:hypothetical protein